METTTRAAMTPIWTLGDRLAKARKMAGLSQQDMADRLFISRTSVNNWENDHNRPTARKVAAWAGVTGVDFVWITAGDDGWAPRGSNPQPTGLRPGGDASRWWRRRAKRVLYAHPHNHPALAGFPKPRQEVAA